MHLANHEEDKAALLVIVQHPKVKAAICDDFSDAFEVRDDWEYVLFGDEGFIAIQPLNYICYQLHIALLPSLWGKGADLGYETGWWLFHNTPCEKLVAMFPAFNKGAAHVVRACGMKQEGVLTASFSKGYKLHDQLIYGITKGEAICQQQRREHF